MNVKLFNTKQAQLLKRALAVYEQQHRAIARNVAHADQRDYTRVNTDFSKELQAAADNSRIKTTRSKHIRVSQFNDGQGRPGRNKNGEKVDLSREMTELAENQIRYDFVTRILNRYYSGLSVSITGRNR
jgi:flagellar basal-body rod protein FlgB